jgi:hypothetical protein
MKSGGNTENIPAPWRRLALAVCVLSLGACQSAATPAMREGRAAAPQLADVAPLSQSSSVIFVLPVEGLQNPLRLVLADAVAASLRDTERPSVLADLPNNQGPTIMISVENVRERGSVVWVSTVWKLRAPYGTIVAERQREMVIDKTLWEQGSVETVNLILDDAMPAVSNMVADFVGPADIAEREGPPSPEPVRTPQDIGGEPAATPILGRRADSGIPLESSAEASASDTLPPQVGEAAPPEPLENLVLDLPAATETDSETVPLPMQVPATAPKAAERPPMALTPEKQPAAAAGLTAEEMTVKPPPDSMARTGRMPASMPAVPPGPPAGPVPLSAPAPPETMAGINQPAADTPVQWGKPAFLIRNVEGAPGDGNRALETAIIAALRGKDLTVTEDPRQAGYEVFGKVDVGPAVNGRQRARITWAVNTMGGQEVGKAVQENVVAAGSLDGSWGQVAVLVSSAAANGIQQLFEAPRPKYTPVGEVPEFPKIPKLPRVPGRALPPPS